MANNLFVGIVAEQYNHLRMVLEEMTQNENIYLDYPLPNNDAPASFSVVSPSNGSTLPGKRNCLEVDVVGKCLNGIW
ncbi:MAG: hypothetical protein IPN09_17065 [Bacteroidetes bacterium]|nr:hypothetical protein [Bacteroidota bacterium]